MSKLPMLQKNSYISILIKDNGISAHLAYTDYNADRAYILSDFTDLTPLRKRIDDEFFTQNFWYEYFDNLEKVFNWDIVQRDGSEIFSFVRFQDEGSGVNGIRVVVDDNQKYFNKIFASLRNFSQDVALRILDDNYARLLVNDIAQRMGYDDLLWIDMDIKNFSVYRSTKIEDKKIKEENRYFQRLKMDWDNDYGVIDSVKDSRIKAFLSTDISAENILNKWSNFVLDKKYSVEDPSLKDILRSYSTIQMYSMYQNKSEKWYEFGYEDNKSAVIITGFVPKVFDKETTLLSIIDGLELFGTFDCYWDLDNKFLTFGRSYIDGPKSSDIVLGKSDIFGSATKVLIPEIRRNRGASRKVVLSGFIESLDLGSNEFFAISPNFTLFDLPHTDEKLVFEGKYKNGARGHNGDVNIQFISSASGVMYDSVLVDSRPRPIIYGPDAYDNRIKLQTWLNDR